MKSYMHLVLFYYYVSPAATPAAHNSKMNIIMIQAWLISFVDFKHCAKWRLVCICVLVLSCFSTAGGQTILPGAPVDVKWLEEWYQGEILEMGRQKDLFQVDYSLQPTCVVYSYLSITR